MDQLSANARIGWGTRDGCVKGRALRYFGAGALRAWGGAGGVDHGFGELDCHVAQAAEANDARGARRALGLGPEVGQRRVGRDACAGIEISSGCTTTCS